MRSLAHFVEFRRSLLVLSVTNFCIVSAPSIAADANVVTFLETVASVCGGSTGELIVTTGDNISLKTAEVTVDPGTGSLTVKRDGVLLAETLGGGGEAYYKCVRGLTAAFGGAWRTETPIEQANVALACKYWENLAFHPKYFDGPLNFNFDDREKAIQVLLEEIESEEIFEFVDPHMEKELFFNEKLEFLKKGPSGGFSVDSELEEERRAQAALYKLDTRREDVSGILKFVGGITLSDLPEYVSNYNASVVSFFDQYLNITSAMTLRIRDERFKDMTDFDYHVITIESLRYRCDRL